MSLLGGIYDCLKTPVFQLTCSTCLLNNTRTFSAFFFSSPLPVAVTEVECVREGCQSEALRPLSGSVPENQCFTVVFKGTRKSLDLLCTCEDEAQHWVRGLRTLKERVANMTQKEKLDQYPAQFPIC